MNSELNHRKIFVVIVLSILGNFVQLLPGQESDPIARLQAQAIETKQADWGHWGPNPEVYSSWTTHSNRLTPIYTFGIDLKSVSGENSIYRDRDRLQQLYGEVPVNTHNPAAEYLDQTDVYRLQQAAVAAGKRRIVLLVFDGMDWETTQAAAIAKTGKVTYREGRGKGLHFLDYRGTTTDYGFFVSSPHNEGTSFNVDRQNVTGTGSIRGGYDPALGGAVPWAQPTDQDYLIGNSTQTVHAYTDSAASATSMTSGIKTYNSAINVDHAGRPVIPLGRSLQEQGFAVGAVSSVPISHATPACAYANNVSRNDYQDLSRDLVGRPSIFHPGGLPGLDVVIGCGWGEDKSSDGGQGKNYVPGNRYLPVEDLNAINVEQGGNYVIAQRTPGESGTKVLEQAVERACKEGRKLFGFFGVKGGHLPYQTANGDYQPVDSVGNPSQSKAEVYSKDDLRENVTLAQMSVAALEVLDARSKKWWLMIEAGDVDWANHANNLDNAIGAVHSGDAAFEAVVNWIENHGGWEDTAVIVTADHGHYLVLRKPEALAGQR